MFFLKNNHDPIFTKLLSAKRKIFKTGQKFFEVEKKNYLISETIFNEKVYDSDSVY